jgi:FHA domain
MPSDQHVNPAEVPPPEAQAAAGTTYTPGVLREPAARVRIQPQVRRIGRHPGNDIVVSDLGVSKRHAELRRSLAGRYEIIDLGSHRGTYVNGTRVSQQELNEGDIIGIGHATLRLAGGELTEYADAGAAEYVPAEAKTVLPREQDVVADLRRQLAARERRIESLQAELRVLAAGNPALLPVLDRLGIRPAPGG